MFSLKKGGIAIARIEGGKHDKKILYLNHDTNNAPITLDIEIIKKLKDPKMKGNKKLSIIREILKEEYDSDDDSDDASTNEFRCDGKISIMPPPKDDERRCVYVSGPSGSGKSYWIAEYGKEYRKINPKNQIVLFSRLDEDESIDKINPTRIEISEDLLRENVTPSDLTDTLTVFDDTDTIRNKKIREEINALKDDILETGRHNNINTVVVSHLMTDREQTRTILNESAAFVFFPKTNVYQIKYVLSHYIGLDNKMIRRILDLPSRWVYLHKNYPRFVAYETGAFII